MIYICEQESHKTWAQAQSSIKVDEKENFVPVVVPLQWGTQNGDKKPILMLFDWDNLNVFVFKDTRGG